MSSSPSITTAQKTASPPSTTTETGDISHAVTQPGTGLRGLFRHGMKPRFPSHGPRAWAIGLEADGRWRSWQGEEPRYDRVEDLANALRNQGYRGESLILTLPSQGCLSIKVPTLDLPKRQGRFAALSYRLEEYLPWAAEELTADFHEGENQAWAVAARQQMLQAHLAALEKQGLPIDWITPFALLAVQMLMPAPPDVPFQGVLLARPDAYEWILLRDGQPWDWKLLPTDPAALRRALAWAVLENSTKPLPVTAWGFTCGSREQLPTLAEVVYDFPPSSDSNLEQLVVEKIRSSISPAPSSSLSASSQETASHTTTNPAAGPHEATPGLTGETLWINLRQGALASPDPWRRLGASLTWALAGSLVLMVSLLVSLLWLGHRYQQQTAKLDAQQTGLFQTLFPGQVLPVNILSRLESEQHRQQTRRSGALEDLAAPPALTMLYEMMRRYPSGLRTRLTDVRVRHNQLTMEGYTRSHGDADLLAAALRKPAGTPARDGFQVEAPRTEQTGDGTVAFTLNATFNPSPLKSLPRPTVTASPRAVSDSGAKHP